MFLLIFLISSCKTIDRKIDTLSKEEEKNLDRFLDPAMLKSQKMTDLPTILYTYTNSKVDTGLDNLGGDFAKWLQTSKISDKKKANVLAYIKEHMAHFKAMWNVVTAIQKAKDDIIAKFDSQGGDVKQTIGNKPGGEGYVLAHPGGDIKLVPRKTFSAANRAVER